MSLTDIPRNPRHQNWRCTGRSFRWGSLSTSESNRSATERRVASLARISRALTRQTGICACANAVTIFSACRRTKFSMRSIELRAVTALSSVGRQGGRVHEETSPMYQWVKWFIFAVLSLPFLYVVRAFQGKGKSVWAKALGIWDGFRGVRVTAETFQRQWIYLLDI